MKKRYLIPTLMLLSATGLTACDTAIGVYVKNGAAYKAGAAQNVNAEVKAAKENKIKTVTETISMDLTIKASANGQSAKIVTKTKGAISVNLEAKTMSGNLKVDVDAAGTKTSQTATFTAKEEDGYVSFETYNDLAYSSYTEEQLNEIYEEASYSVYSWNYSPESSNLQNLIEQTGQSGVSASETVTLYKKITNALAYTGDFTTGTFEIGLSKAVTSKISGADVTFNKFLTSYKDGLADSSVFGFKFSVTESGTKVSVDLTASTKFSYTFVA